MLGDNLVPVTLGFVDVCLHVLSGGGHVLKGVGDLGRGLDVLQLNRHYVNTHAVIGHHFLDLLLNSCLYVQFPRCKHRVHGVVPNHLPDACFGDVPQVDSGSRTLKERFHIVDPVLNDHRAVYDVLVAGEHLPSRSISGSENPTYWVVPPDS